MDDARRKIMPRTLTQRISAALKGYAWRRSLRELVKQVDHLSIAKADVDQGIPYVQLYEGPIFFGFPPRGYDRGLYRMLSRKTRSRLPQECFRVARDIVVRYQGAGLMRGGPTKEQHYSVNPGDIVVETGAYIGFYIIKMAEKVGPSGRVIAIEPIPENVTLLQRNVEANDLSNVTIIPKGVWDHRDIKAFSIRPQARHSGSLVMTRDSEEVMDVEVDSLDALLDVAEVTKVDLMILQLNGAELNAVRGLTQVHPKHFAIAARYCPDGLPVAQKVSRLLTERGYTVKIVDEAFIYAHA